MTFVKICGLKEMEHVQTAVENGASLIGFVFAPSSRQISIEKAKELATLIPEHIKKVGVFVNEEAQMIQHIFQEVPLDYVQYHGDESAEFIAEIGLPSIKAISVNEETNFEQLLNYNVDYFLFDAPGISYRGGSGHTFNWDILSHCPIDKKKIILAGGLHATNVASAIQQVKPFAVDVSSGVETERVKDHVKIKEFIQAVKGVSMK